MVDKDLKKTAWDKIPQNTSSRNLICTQNSMHLPLVLLDVLHQHKDKTKRFKKEKHKIQKVTVD